MGGFADQRDAMAGELLGALDRQRKHIAPGFDLDAAENGVRLPFSAASDNSSSLSAISRSASRVAETHTTLQRLPGRGTNTHGPCGV